MVPFYHIPATGAKAFLRASRRRGERGGGVAEEAGGSGDGPREECPLTTAK
jgi:hypothetical protein